MHSDNNMKQRIYEAALKDTPDLKHQIKADSRFRHYKKRFNFASSPLLRIVTTFSVMAIGLIVLFTNLAIPTQAYSTVYVEINPLIEMDFDRQDNLIDIRSHHSGEVLETRMRDHMGEPYLDSLTRLIEYAIEVNLLDEDNPAILIDVDSADESKRTAMETVISSHVPDFVAERVQGGYMIRGNQRDASDVEMNNAAAMNMSVMRYRLIHTLSEATGEDPEVYKNIPMHQLRQRLDENDVPVDIPSATDRPHRPHDEDDNDTDDYSDDHTPGPPDGVPRPNEQRP